MILWMNKPPAIQTIYFIVPSINSLYEIMKYQVDFLYCIIFNFLK